MYLLLPQVRLGPDISQNNHRWGDNWNGEDLSLYSVDDSTLPLVQSPSATSVDTSSPSFSEARSSEDSVRKELLQKTMSVDQMRASSQSSSDVAMFRAAEAYVRPSPIYTNGEILSHGFDLKQYTFTLSLIASKSTDQGTPTIVYLQQYHIPSQDTVVEASGGQWRITFETVQGIPVQQLSWWHSEGEQKLKVQGVKRIKGRIVESLDGEEGYLEQCRRACAMM